jgi:hypothetical protein
MLTYNGWVFAFVAHADTSILAGTYGAEEKIKIKPKGGKIKSLNNNN